jgi:hypothetical protein
MTTISKIVRDRDALDLLATGIGPGATVHRSRLHVTAAELVDLTVSVDPKDRSAPIIKSADTGELIVALDDTRRVRVRGPGSFSIEVTEQYLPGDWPSGASRVWITAPSDDLAVALDACEDVGADVRRRERLPAPTGITFQDLARFHDR